MEAGELRGCFVIPALFSHHFPFAKALFSECVFLLPCDQWVYSANRECESVILPGRLCMRASYISAYLCCFSG